MDRVFLYSESLGKTINVDKNISQGMEEVNTQLRHLSNVQIVFS